VAIRAGVAALTRGAEAAEGVLAVAVHAVQVIVGLHQREAAVVVDDISPAEGRVALDATALVVGVWPFIEVAGLAVHRNGLDAVLCVAALA
jgi:hypothetical protein